MFHKAGFALGDVGGNAQLLVQELREHAMTLVDGGAIGKASLGEGDIAIIRLLGKRLLLKRGDRLVHGSLGNAHFVGDVDRSDGHLRGAPEHYDGLKVILVRFGHLLHWALLS